MNDNEKTYKVNIHWADKDDEEVIISNGEYLLHVDTIKILIRVMNILDHVKYLWLQILIGNLLTICSLGFLLSIAEWWRG